LNIFNVCAAQNATQGAFVHGVADAFAGPRNHFKQQTQLRGDVAFAALLFNQVA
jgi:hypothetical protein